MLKGIAIRVANALAKKAKSLEELAGLVRLVRRCTRWCFSPFEFQDSS